MSTRNYKSTWRNSMNYQRYSNVTVNTATFRLTQKKLSQNMLGWAKWMGGSWSQHTRCQLNTSTLIHPAICKIHQESGPHITKYLFSALHKRICAIKLLFREPTNSTSPLPSYHPLASKAESLWYRIRACRFLGQRSSNSNDEKPIKTLMMITNNPPSKQSNNSTQTKLQVIPPPA